MIDQFAAVSIGGLNLTMNRQHAAEGQLLSALHLTISALLSFDLFRLIISLRTEQDILNNPYNKFAGDITLSVS